MSDIIIHVNSAKGTIANYQVNSSSSKALHIQAHSDVKYNLIEKNTGLAPKNITSKRVGKDLHITFEGDDINNPDLIIDDYYGHTGEALTGKAEDGLYHDYVSEGGDTLAKLQDGSSAGQVLGGEGFATPLWVEADGFGLGTLALIAAGIGGAAAAASGGGGDSSTPNSAPVLAATDVTGAKTETTTTGTLTDSGTIAFTDVNPTDTHTVSVTNPSTGALGTLTAVTSGSANTMTWTYTVADAAVQYLAAGETKVETFNVTLSDGHGGTDVKTISVTITGTNDAATVSSESVQLTETNAALTTGGTLTSADVDNEDNAFIAQTNVAGTNGTFSIGTNGVWTYTANSAFNSMNVGDSNTETFNVASVDGTASTITVQINGTNDAAIISSASVQLDETNAVLTTSGTLTSIDVDNTNNAFMASSTTGTYGNFAIDAAGAWTFTANSAFDSLDAGQNVAETFSVTSVDGTLSSVTVTVTGTNDAPVAIVDTGAVNENLSVTVNVLANDTDLDDGHVFTLSSVSSPKGTAAIVANELVFTATAADFDHLAQGVTEDVVVTYTMSDEHGATSTSTATITVTGTNDAPVAIVDTGAVNENLSVTVNVLANDTDLDDGHVFTLSSVSSPKGTAAIVANELVFTATAADFDHLAQGVTEDVVVTYTMSDEHGATSTSTATITVTGTNDAPIINAVASENTYEDGFSITGTVTSSDVDTGATATYTAPTDPAIAGFEINPGTGAYSFDPSAPAYQYLGLNQALTVTIPVTVTDENGATDVTDIVINLRGTNDTPVAAVDTGMVNENSSVTVDVLTNDADLDAGHVFTLSSVSSPKGTVSIVDNQLVFVANAADFDHLAQDVAENVIVTYTMRDEHGATSTSTATITVTGTNDAAIVSSETKVVSETNAALTTGGTLTSADVDNADNAFIASSTTGTYGDFAIDAAGVWTFTANSEFNELNVGQNVSETFDVASVDGTPSTVTVTINGTNDAATVSSASVQLAETNAALTTGGTLTSTDVDNVDNAFTESSTTGTYGDFAIDAAGVWTFTANSEFNELNVGQNVSETFDVASVDGTPSTVTVIINGTNDTPIVAAVSASTLEATSGTITTFNSAVDLSATDLDANTTFDFSLVVGTVTVTPTVGNASFNVNDISVVVNGSGEYQVMGNFENLSAGDELIVRFDYVANDGIVNSMPATVTLTITGTNDVPVAKNITMSVTEGSLADSIDPVSENTTFTSVINLTSENDLNDTYTITMDGAITPYISSGSFINNTDPEAPDVYVVDNSLTKINIDSETGEYTIYNPTFNNLAEGETVTINFGYIVNDGADNDYGRVSFTVTGTNDAPVAVVDSKVLVSEDFEGGATGWTNNATDAATAFTKFLGRFDNTTGTVSKTFDLGVAAGTAVTIEFDMYEIDSWDGESFLVSVNGDLSSSTAYAQSNLGTSNIAFGGWTDELHHYIIQAVADANGQVTIAFSSTLNQDVSDESWGIDNLTITQNEVVAFTTDEDTELTIDVLANDTDVDTNHVFTLDSIDAVSVELTTATVSIDPETNQLVFNPGTDFDYLSSGESVDVTVNYTMSDEQGASSSSTATLTVIGTNDTPVVEDIIIDVSESDLTVVDPDNSNPAGENATFTSTVNLTSINDLNDTYTITQDAGVTPSITSGSYMADGITYVVDMDQTVIVVNNDGSYSISNPTFNNLAESETVTIEFGYVVDDGLDQDNGIVTVIVTGTNDQPIVSDLNIGGTSVGLDAIDNTLTSAWMIQDVQETFVATQNNLGKVEIELYYPISGYNGTFQILITDALGATVYTSATLSTADVTGINTNNIYGWETGVLSADMDVSLNIGSVYTMSFIPVSGNVAIVTSAASNASDGLGLILYNGNLSDTEDVSVRLTYGSGEIVILETNRLETIYSGQLEVTDADTTDTHTFAVDPLTVASSAAAVTGLSVTVTDADTGAYTVEGNFDALAEGETATITFDYIATDSSLTTEGLPTDNAVSEVKTVTLTVTGTNDQPVVEDVYAESNTAITTGAGQHISTTYGEYANFSFVAENSTITSLELSVDNDSFTTSTQGSGVSFVIQDSSTGDTVYESSVIDVNQVGTELFDNLNITVVEGASYLIIVTGDNNHYSLSSFNGIVLNLTYDNGQPVILESNGLEEPICTGTLTLTEDLDAIDAGTHTFAQDGTASVETNGMSTAVVTDLLVVVNPNGTYTVDGNFDALAEGETATITFDYTATDGSGAGNATSVAQTVTLTVTGTNDAPVIEVVDADATILEGTTLTDAGSITFTDLDFTDRPTAAAVMQTLVTTLELTLEQAGAIEAAFTITPDIANTNNGTINWDYTILDTELDFLGQDETVTATFTITVWDGLATATKDVTVTLTGTNDAPLIQVVDVAGLITETGDQAVDAADLTDAGSITFTDLDLTDTPTATAVMLPLVSSPTVFLTIAQEAAIEEAFTLPAVINTNDGTINWDYTIAETSLDFLGEGETVTATFTVTVDDGLATATKDVTVTLTGTNDAPEIQAVDVAGLITEAGDQAVDAANLTDAGSITFTDLDLTDRPTATVTAIVLSAQAQAGQAALLLTPEQEAAIEAAFTITPDGINTNDGTINWGYTIAETALDFLREGDVVTATFTIKVDDNKGGTATQDATVTINGAHDAPSIGTAGNDTFLTDGTETIDGLGGIDTVLLETGITLNFSNLSNIEIIDLTINGDHDLGDLSVINVAGMTDGINNILTIVGDAGDSLNLVASDWNTYTSSGTDYTIYRSTTTPEELHISNTITVYDTGVVL